MARGKEKEVELMISVEHYTRTRDTVIMALSNLQKGLAHVQSGVNELMNAYIKHTSSVLAGEEGAAESLQLPDNIAEVAAAANFAINNVSQAAAAAATTAAAPAATDADTGKGKKRKREKKEKDPNQPKRPLTAAFLYAQSARPVVRKDLENELPPGAKLEPNAINLEVNKRWNEMSEEDKNVWKASYRDSMEQYNKDMAAYKAGLGGIPIPEEPVEEEVSDEAEVEAGALDSDIESDSDDDEPSPVKAPTPPPTANSKNPRANKRQKITATPQVNGISAPVSSAPAQTPVPLPSNARPSTQVPLANTAAEKKDKKKKEKPQAIAPAPAAKEPSPDDPKKKAKTGRATRNGEAEGEEKATKKRERSKRKSEGAAAA